MEQTTSEPKGIYKAMAAIAAEIGAIGKDKRCTQGASFAYRGIDDVYNSLNPIMAKHDVFMLPIAGERTTDQRQTKTGGIMEIVVLRMTYRFCHSDGSYVECCTIGQAMDSGDKATNKAMAIAHKYAILQAFCIPTEDMEDPDAVAEQLAPKQPPRQQYQQQPQRQQPQQQHTPQPRMSDAQRRAMMAYFGQLGITDKEPRIAYAQKVVGRSISSCNELTPHEASKVIDSLKRSANNAQ